MTATNSPLPDTRFAVLDCRRWCWVVGAVHSAATTLEALHARMLPHIQPGDTLVYLGNLIGHTASAVDAIDVALRFRRQFLTLPGATPEDVVFLRGGQEEIWHKLLQVQFAPNPGEVLDWMLAHGVGGTLAAYGGDPAHGRDAARRGAVALTEWTNRLRTAMRQRDGHVAFMSSLKRSACTRNHALLLVNAGLDPTRALAEQNDSFWWGGREFDALAKPYGDFRRIVRGFDARRHGIVIRPHTVSLDGGCGFDGTLATMAFDLDGEIQETIEIDA